MDASINVGGLALPLAAGDANGGISDIALLGLLDFGGFLIKWALDARLAQQQGPGQSGEPVTDACPVANRYPYNPETTHVRLPKPALFAWWADDSQIEEKTTIYTVEKRTIRMLYMSQEVVLPGGMAARHGVPRVVSACFAKIGNEGYHPAYGYGTDPPGTSIAASIGARLLAYNGGAQSMMFEVPGNTTVADQGKTGGHVQRGYPVCLASFAIWEKVGVSSGSDPANVTPDALFSLATNEGGDLDDTIAIRSAYVPGADGSETP